MGKDNELCICSNFEWSPEMYNLEHHPNCPTKLGLAPPQAYVSFRVPEKMFLEAMHFGGIVFPYNPPIELEPGLYRFDSNYRPVLLVKDKSARTS